MKSFNGTPVATIYNDTTGRPFTMRLVRKGQGYGRDLQVIHDRDEPLVEFYDAQHSFKGERGAEFGQFVSRYYLSTLLRGHAADSAGLCLDGGVPAWQIDAAGMRAAVTLLAMWAR